MLIGYECMLILDYYSVNFYVGYEVYIGFFNGLFRIIYKIMIKFDKNCLKLYDNSLKWFF